MPAPRRFGVFSIMPWFTRRSRPSAHPTMSPLPAPTRLLLLLIGAFALLLPAVPVAAADFTPEQHQAIEAIVHDYLTKNPEILLDALQTAEDKMKTDAH